MSRGREPETIEIQLMRKSHIRVSTVQRGYKQYTITIPSRIAERWIEEFGTRIRFEIEDDGIVIRAAKEETVDLPAWAKESS